MPVRPTIRLFPLVFVAPLLFGSCAKQDEGERCNVLNNSADCSSGLECVAQSELLRSEADRCCPPEGDRISDDRCRRRTSGASSSTGGTSATTPTGGTAGAISGGGGAAGFPPTGAGGSPGGSAGTNDVTCLYRSDCPEGQTCGPTGRCQPECRTDRDCFPGEICSAAGACLTPANAGQGGGA